ncbi:MAG TPA: sulfite exporter TauE/SafE family protein [Bryobacteraceae bacterium]|nr:sulfite exporter TauE/SafE family protein [Bryobacteraceae bacterium]
MQSAYLILLGIAAGAASGLVGIGGGIILIPALVFLFGMSQHQAQGTTLALMVPPIGLVAAMAYWRQGYVDIRIAALICIGFLAGSLIGARYSLGISDAVLQKVFGLFLLLLSTKMLFTKGGS